MDRMNLSPGLPALLIFILTLPLAACDSYEARKTAYLNKGKALFDEGDYARARLELKNTLQIDKKQAEAWYVLGRVEEREGAYRKAYANYLRAIELSPKFIDARVHKARLLVAAKEFDAASLEVETVLGLAPEHPDVLATRGVLNHHLGDDTAAEADARAALSIDSSHVGATLLLASLQLNKNALKQAVDTLHTAVLKSPNDASLLLTLGQVYESKGDVDEAIGVLQTLAEQYPEKLDYHIRLATYYEQKQRFDEAEAVLRKLLRAAPDDLSRQRALIRFLARIRNIDTAQSELALMLKRQPHSATLRFMEAELVRHAGDIERAEAIYHEIIQRADKASPEGIKARNMLAQLLMSQKRDTEVAALVDAVLNESAHEPDALQLRALLALRSGDTAQAIADLRLVLRDHPRQVSAHQLLGQAHVLQKEFALAQGAFEQAIALAPSDPTIYRQLAEVQVSGGDNEGALITLERLLEKAPDNAGAQQAIAQIQLSERDWDALDHTAGRIKSTRPGHPLGYYLEGLVLQYRQEFGAAIAAFDKALELQPDNIETQIAIARSQLAMGAASLAEQHIRQILRKHPNSLVANNLLGDLYLSTGALNQAQKIFEEAVRFHPKSPRAYVRLTQIKLSNNDKAGARKILEAGVVATERNSFLVFQLAGLLEQMGEYNTAVATYDEVLSRYPESKMVINNLAMLLASRIDRQEALDRAFELAKQLEGIETPEYLDTLGWVHLQKGDLAAAVSYLEKGAIGKPGDPEILYHLGMAYRQLGRNDEAKKHLSVAAAAKDFVYSDEAQKALKEIENIKG